MTEAEAIVSRVACLLVVRTVLSRIMRSGEILREGSGLKRCKIPLFGQNQKCPRQRHVERMKDSAPSRQVLWSLSTLARCTSERIGGCGLGFLILSGCRAGRGKNCFGMTGPLPIL